MAYASGLFDDRDEPPPPDGPSRRVTAVLVGAGLVLLLAAGAGFAALRSDEERRPARPPGARQPVAPVVPVNTDSPSAASPSPSTAPPSPPAPTTTTATATAKPPPAPTATRGVPRVTSVNVSAHPAVFTSCRGRLTTDLTVRVTLSVAGATVRYTINDLATVHKTATGTTFSETTRIAVPAGRGEYRVQVTVSQPSAAATETTLELDCGH
jgi:hypothetical protein